MSCGSDIVGGGHSYVILSNIGHHYVLSQCGPRVSAVGSSLTQSQIKNNSRELRTVSTHYTLKRSRRQVNINLIFISIIISTYNIDLLRI